VHPSLSSVASIETARRAILGLLLNDVDYNIKQFMVSARIDNRIVNDTLTTLLSYIGLPPVVLLIKHTAAGFKRVLAGLLGGLLTGVFVGLLVCMFVSCLFVCNTYI
jgi:ABC-type nitrate/sulfonate/bicarbonate transport system permease component